MTRLKNAPLSASRFAIAAIAILACVLSIITTARFGFSKILGRYALMSNSIAVANEAVRLAPSDPQAHQARSIVLNNLRLTSEAAQEMETAVSLRPHDDYLWLELGNLREATGSAQAALEAFDNAVRFAPHYGHTHWQRGNLLVRMGRYDEGFSELRRAVASNRDFLPPLIDLAWGISRGDAKITEELVQVAGDDSRLAFARFLAQHGRAEETIAQLGQVTRPIPRELRRDLISNLIQNKSYTEAYALWKHQTTGTDAINNSSFESDLILDEIGFGWEAAKLSGVGFVLDLNQPHNGVRSLRISFDGYEGQEQTVFSQLLPVTPSRQYRLSFALKTRDLVSGGLPLLVVSDANTGHLLAKSDAFHPSAGDWVEMTLHFASLSSSNAVSLKLQRNRCSNSPCPIFGHVWLDSFSLAETQSK